MVSADAQHGEPAHPSSQDGFLLYDGECPFCSLFARKSKFETLTGRGLRLIDAH